MCGMGAGPLFPARGRLRRCGRIFGGSIGPLSTNEAYDWVCPAWVTRTRSVKAPPTSTAMRHAVYRVIACSLRLPIRRQRRAYKFLWLALSRSALRRLRPGFVMTPSANRASPARVRSETLSPVPRSAIGRRSSAHPVGGRSRQSGSAPGRRARPDPSSDSSSGARRRL
jgi:hypothetical protein